MKKFTQFLLKVDKSIMKHLSPWWKGKGCHGTDNEKRCHGSVPVPVTRLRYRCKGEVCGCVQKMVGRSRIPGVPRVGDKETSDNLDTVQTRASQTSQAFVHGRRLEVIPSKRALSEGFMFDVL